MLHQNYYLVTFIKGNGNIFLPRPKFLTIRRSCRLRIRTRKVPLRFWGITNSSRRTCWTVSRERLFIPETQKENGFNLNLSFDTHSCKIVAALEYRAQQETWLALWNDEKGFGSSSSVSWQSLFPKVQKWFMFYKVTMLSMMKKEFLWLKKIRTIRRSCSWESTAA